MAHINTKRFHSLAVNNRVITHSATGLFESIESVIEDSIEHRIFITVSSNNAENRFKATTGDIITILVFTMTDIDEPTIEIHPFLNDEQETPNSWSAIVDDTPSGSVWIAKFTIPSISESQSTNLKQYIDVRVVTKKNNEPIIVSYTPIEYNRIELFI